MKANGAGEFGLIARLAARLQAPKMEGVVGIGDDTAAVPRAGGFMLLTCDIAIAGRHFLQGTTPMADVGWKVAVSCVSDIAACGGLPEHALVSLGVPEDIGAESLDELYDGLAEAAAHYGFEVLGGNVSGATELVVDCFMVGKAARFISRGGAKPGELVAVSGTLGDSDAGGTILADAGARVAREPHRSLVGRHLRPQARIDLVEPLGKWATAAIDISDSLASELHHLSASGGVGLAVEREKIPLSPELKTFAVGTGEDPMERALFGGEDYQILCTLPKAHGKQAETAGFTLIGEVVKEKCVLLSGEPLPAKGWDHLR